MMYFFASSLPEVNLMCSPASCATSTKVTGNGRPDGAALGTGMALCVEIPWPRQTTPAVTANRAAPYFIRCRCIFLYADYLRGRCSLTYAGSSFANAQKQSQ